jgi:hypothetical protein
MDPHDSSLDDLRRKLQLAEIPKEFYSDYLDAPFARCVDCERQLLDSDEVYSVLKSYVGKEPVFEMAICADCSTRLAESYSEESKANFRKAMADWSGPARALFSDEEPPEPQEQPRPLMVAADVDRLEHCGGCGRSRSECRRYSIVGAFLGSGFFTPTIAPFSLPLMICDECNAAATENISRHTRDTWDRFVEENFDGPPGIELDSPRLDPVLI